MIFDVVLLHFLSSGRRVIGTTSTTEEKVSRVICFDLWGTLISSHLKMTYEDYLSRWVSRDEIRVFVRQNLMIDPETAKFVHESSEQSPFRCHIDITPPCLLGYTGLAVRLINHFEYEYAHGRAEETPRVEVVVELWQRENKAAEWLPGVLDVLERTRQSDTKLVLVTNTTGQGWKDTGERLEVSEYFTVDGLYRSSDWLAAKPDPYVWESLTHRFPADEYWMVGNDPVIDLAVPKAMGWRTVLVNHPDGVPVTQVPEVIAGRQ